MKSQIIPKNEIIDKYLIFNKKKKAYVKIRKNSVILKKDAVLINQLWTDYAGDIGYVIKFVDGTSEIVKGKEKKIVSESCFFKTDIK